MAVLVGGGVFAGVSFFNPASDFRTRYAFTRGKQAAWERLDPATFGWGTRAGPATPLYFYIAPSLTASGSSHGALTERAIAADISGNTGWTLGTNTGYALMAFNSIVTTFAAPAQPASAPTTNDCFRSENKYTGTFAAGTWAISLCLAAQIATPATIAMSIRLWRSSDPTGATGITEITAGAVATSTVTTTSSPQSWPASPSLAAASLNDEYLFIQIAVHSFGPGAASSDAVILGNSQSKSIADIITPVFTPGATTSSGDAAITLGAATLSATATVDIAAAASITLGAATLAADGTVASAGNNAALAVTLGAATLSSAGTLAIAGAASPTLGAAALSAAGQVAIAGASAKTLGAATLAATGTVAIAASATPTLGAATLAATGAVAIAGALTRTLGAATVLSAGTVAVAGTSTRTLSPATLSSAGQVVIAGASTTTLGAATLAATGVVGSVPITGDASIQLAPATLSASGAVAVAGALSKTLGAATLAASSVVAIGGALSASLGSATVASAGTVSDPVVDTSVADQSFAAESQGLSMLVASAQEATAFAGGEEVPTSIAGSPSATTYVTGENPS